jgi:arylsulfatase A-like enzyme/predicted Zn-dependent protease
MLEEAGSQPAFLIMQRPDIVLRSCLNALALLSPLLVLAACRGRSAVAPSAQTPVILISIDTLRSDHLPIYGYKDVATPNIDGLRHDGILFQRAYSHCPLTLPSHTTMLTGLLPSENGMRDNVGFRLDEKIPTLPALLKRNGYATGAAISAFVLRGESGLGRGFDLYDDEVSPIGPSQVIGRVQREGEETTRVAEHWLDGHGDKPFFFFLHLYEPHSPYHAAEPFFSRYANKYDGEIAYVDQIVGDFLGYLKKHELYDKALIILVSDHGEGLNEHGEEEHGIFLYREDLQVPLVVKLPKSRQAGATVEMPVELIDIFPTILEQTSTTVPVTHNSARSLLSFLGGSGTARPVYAESYYPRFHFGWSDLHSLIDGPNHFIRAPIPELYDLVKDPLEKSNVIDANRRTYVAMRTALEPFVKQAAAPAPVDPEEAAKLAALGYVGSTVATGAGEVLPDPKNTIDVFRQIRVAYTLYRNGKEDEALQLTNKLLADNSRILDLWDLKANILMKLGRNDEAIAAAKSGLQKQPNTVSLIVAVANLSILTGNLDDAQKHAELLLKTEPSRAHEVLSRVFIARKDYARATQEAQASLQGSPDRSAGLLALGLIEKQQGHLQEALQYFDQAVATVAEHKNHQIANLHFYRGDVLARLGRNEAAEAEFRQEMAAYPTAPEAYTSLILLLSSEGRLQEATELTFKLVQIAPYPASYRAISETMKAMGDDRGAVYWAYQGLQKFPSNRELKGTLRNVQKAAAVRN